jgi:hypothetical protein
VQGIEAVPTSAGAAFALLAPSPAQLGDSQARAIAVEDLHAMAHRFLPDFALGYLERDGRRREGAGGLNHAANKGLDQDA